MGNIICACFYLYKSKLGASRDGLWGVAQLARRLGCTWKRILVTLWCLLEYCDLSAVVQGKRLLFLIDNMLDGELWLFPSSRREEGNQLSRHLWSEGSALGSMRQKMSLTDILLYLSVESLWSVLRWDWAILAGHFIRYTCVKYAIRVMWAL